MALSHLIFRTSEAVKAASVELPLFDDALLAVAALGLVVLVGAVARTLLRQFDA